MTNFFLSFIFLIISLNLVGQSFVNPINFTPTESNKKRVIKYIEKQVKEDYSAINMDDPSTLRMMEKENLNAFKELTKAKNTRLLNSVIKTYCEIGMCNYSTILLMYNEQNKASKESLSW